VVARKENNFSWKYNLRLTNCYFTCLVRVARLFIFQTKNPYLDVFYVEAHGIDNLGIFCGRSEYFSTIRYVSWLLGIFCGHLVNFSSFWYGVTRIICQPCA
jgi:hypothetical protein